MFPDTPLTLLRKIADLAQGDDRAEWDAFVELYAPPLRRFVLLQSPSSSESDVEDVVQDVFVRLVTVLRQGKVDRTKARFRSYLASVARRILIDRYRAAQVRPQLKDDIAADGRKPDPMSDIESEHVKSLDPGTAVDLCWRMAVREAAKDHVFTKTAVSEQSKTIYRLLETGRAPREVAAQVGVSRDVVKQVKSRIDRAIAAIERQFL